MLRHRKETASIRRRNVATSDDDTTGPSLYVDNVQSDGIRQLEYNLVDSSEKLLFTHILVKV
jgi:hypothetical protein